MSSAPVELLVPMGPAYCLAVAADRCNIELYYAVAMSNHVHTGGRDTDGKYPEFLQVFHSLLARCMNALWGRRENFWSVEETSKVELGDARSVLDSNVYAVTNPVKAHLVDAARNWPGFWSNCGPTAAR